MIAYYTGQYREVADVFYDAIHVTSASCYDDDQLSAWAPLPIDYESWKWRCEFKRPFLYLLEERVVGFIELDADGHIDCHYVLSDVSRQGIGGELLEHAIRVAQQRGLPRLFVEASHLARGLYLKHDFEVVRENKVERNGVVLENWIMERSF